MSRHHIGNYTVEDLYIWKAFWFPCKHYNDTFWKKKRNYSARYMCRCLWAVDSLLAANLNIYIHCLCPMEKEWHSECKNQQTNSRAISRWNPLFAYYYMNLQFDFFSHSLTLTCKLLTYSFDFEFQYRYQQHFQREKRSIIENVRQEINKHTNEHKNNNRNNLN